jgi:hypothetical protein
MEFLTLYYCVQSFLCEFFCTLFNGFKLSIKFCVLWYLYRIFHKTFFAYTVFFANVKAKLGRNDINAYAEQ